MSFEFKNDKQIQGEQGRARRRAEIVTSSLVYIIPLIGCFNVYVVAVKNAKRISASSGPTNIFRLHALISFLWWPLFIWGQMLFDKTNALLGMALIAVMVLMPFVYSRYFFKFYDAARAAGKSWSTEVRGPEF